MRSVKYFMWGFQDTYLSFTGILFRELCERIGCDLEADLFLVGVRREGASENLFPVCIEPDSHEIQPEDLKGAPARATEIHTERRTTVVEHHSEWHYEEYERKHYTWCVRAAIVEAVHDRSPEGTLVYCSTPTPVENYLVSMVIRFPKARRDEWPHLSNNTYEMRNSTGGPSSVPTSLIDCLIDEFLDTCDLQLTRRNPGQLSDLQVDVDSVVRSAGRSFMYKVSSVGDSFEGLHGLFDSCNEIAKLKYESSEISGAIIISRNGHTAIERSITFKSPTPIRNHRAVRKQLELCTMPVALLSDAANITGLGRITEGYDPTQEDVYTIIFQRGSEWEVWHHDKVLMRTRFGVPMLPQRTLNERKLRDILSRRFPSADEQKLEKLTSLAIDAVGLGKGTTLVISDRASDEAARLMSQCTPVDPFEMTATLLKQVAAIDGAILLDQYAQCHAIGVILDGMASPKGDSSRGSRYNSALRYLSPERATVILVVSEDGMINIIPDLMPRISRTELQQQLETFRRLETLQEVNHDEYYKVMDWFNNHRFYLDSATCEIVNRWEELAQRRPGRTSYRVYSAFEPDEDMDDSYFL